MRGIFRGGLDYSHVALHLPFVRNFADHSRYARAYYAIGNNFTISSNAAYLDGTGDSLRFYDANEWWFSTGDFYIKANVKLLSYAAVGSIRHITAQDNTGSTRAHRFGIENISGAQYLVFMGSTTGSDLIRVASTPWTPGLNVYAEAAVSRRKQQLTLFIDGVPVATVADTYAYANSATYLTIGAYAAITQSFHGFLSDLIIAKGASLDPSGYRPNAFILPPINTRCVVHGAAALPRTALPSLFLSQASSVITGACTALDNDDASSVAAVLRTTGILTAAGEVDAAVLVGAAQGLVAAEGGDVAALAGQLGTAAVMSAGELADLTSLLGKVSTLGTLVVAALTLDECAILGRVWPTMYKAITGISLSSPASTLALSSAESTLGGFPPVVISDVTMPDEAGAGTFPPVVVSDVTMP